jgi:hypothetical protein
MPGMAAGQCDLLLIRQGSDSLRRAADVQSCAGMPPTPHFIAKPYNPT